MDTINNNNPLNMGLTIALAICLLILPNLHVSLLSNQAIIPREIFLYVSSILFFFILYRSAPLRYNSFFAMAAIFCFWQFLSLFWSSDYSAGLQTCINSFYYLLAAFALYQVGDDAQRRNLLTALVAGVSISALIGVLQNFAIEPLPLFQASPPSSTFVNKNLAASASLLVLPVSLMLLLTAKQSIHKLFHVLTGSLLFSYVLVAHSKGVWLAGILVLILGAALLTSISRRREIEISLRRDKFHLATIFAIGIILFSLPSAKFTDLSAEEQYDVWSGSATTRLNIYRDAVQLVAEHPVIGIGEGSFRREFRSEPGGNYFAQHASQDAYVTLLHNDHLQYLVELGVVGFLLWAGTLFLMYRHTAGFLFANSDNNRQLMTLALLLGITATLIHALFSFPVRIPSTASLFWICIGLLMSYQNESKSAQRVCVTPRLRRLSSLLYGVVLLCSVYLVSTRAVGSYYLQLAEDAIFERGQCNEAKHYLNKSMQASGLDIRLTHIATITYDVCGHNPASEMEALMDRILEYEPNQAKALVIKGKLAFLRGDYETAAGFFYLALQVNPVSNDAAMGFAQCEKKLRQTK